MKTMRRRIIEYMQVKKVLSAADISRAFKISAADARHHLASLEQDHVVSVIDTRGEGRGRPTQRYSLTFDLERNNLDSLLSAVFGEWFKNLPEENKEAALGRVADQLVKAYPSPEGNLTQRLTRAVRRLNDMNYQARWEAHINAPRILVTHCPYAAAIGEYPEICWLDQFVLEKLLGAKVNLVSRHEDYQPGEGQCIFHLSQGVLM